MKKIRKASENHWKAIGLQLDENKFPVDSTIGKPGGYGN